MLHGRNGRASRPSKGLPLKQPQQDGVQTRLAWLRPGEPRRTPGHRLCAESSTASMLQSEHRKQGWSACWIGLHRGQFADTQLHQSTARPLP
jgi:hypothetical protein